MSTQPGYKGLITVL